MRLIGHLPEKSSALLFSDFLYVQGIGNDVDSEKDGWAIWIHGEDEVPRAKELLSQFKTNPTDPKYQERAREAGNLKEQERIEEIEAKKRHFDRTKITRGWRPYGMGPLTLSLIVVCVAVAFFSQLGKNRAFLDPLFITSLSNWTPWTQPLAEIRHGEVWRLITPIFIHFGFPHLIFNMLAMLDLGSMVEARQGSIRLALLVLVTGVISNLAQFYFDVWFSLSSFTFHFGPGMPNFGGISGVAYALLGYIWMKSKFDPGSGYFLQSQAVMMMLVWFFLCLAHVIPGVANTAHAGGLVVGMAWGYLSSLPSKRRRT